MIVYNVDRRWFVLKDEADRYRVTLGLKPAATLKIEVDGRVQLTALLNALCSPPALGKAIAPATDALVDRAYVPVDRDIPDCVPDFLLKAHGITR